MKVLQVNCVYRKGSTGKLTYELHKGLKGAGISSVVCYGRGDKVYENGVYKVCGELESHIYKAYTMLNGLKYSGCFRSTRYLERIIERENPDVVHLQCINGYFVNIYELIQWLKGKSIPTVLTLHAEFMYTGNCNHSLDCERWRTGCGNCPHFEKETHSIFIDNTHKSWKRMQNAFVGFEHLEIVSVSPWLMERAMESPILKGMEHSVILNGVDTRSFHYQDTEALRKEYNALNKSVFFHATPSFSVAPDHFKGGYYVCELAKIMPDAVFLVAGPYSGDPAIPDNVKLLGWVTDQNKLGQYYAMADATIITSKRETFSMVAAESLCCGTPVAGFKAGAPEQIAIPEYSDFVEHGNTKALYEAIRSLVSSGFNKNVVSQAAIEKYSSQTMVHNYMKIYEKVSSL